MEAFVTLRGFQIDGHLMALAIDQINVCFQQVRNRISSI